MDILIIVILLGMTAGVGLVACGPRPAGTPPPGSSNTAPPVIVSTQTPMPVGAGTVSPNLPTSTPPPAITVVAGDCPEPLTPTPFPDLEPWKHDEGYDAASNAILNWGAPAGDNVSRTIRSHKVWEWMGSVPGWWNGFTIGYPSAYDLAAWLLEREGGSLLNIRTIEANPNGSWRTGIRAMAGLMGEQFNNGITDVELSTYTAFFNPKVDSVFDERDWAALNRPPSSFMYDYIDEYLYDGVYIHTDAKGKQYRVTRWWDDGIDAQSGYCSTTCVVVFGVRIPDENKTLFFGYDPRYD